MSMFLTTLRRATPAILLVATVQAGTAQAPGQVIDEYLRRLTGFGYSGAVLVRHGDAVVLRQAYGMAQTFTGRTNTVETAFDLASLTKQFTATAIMALEEDGRLAITDPLHRHLPGVPDDKRAVTIEHLLGHTAGVTRGFPRSATSAEVVRRILDRPLEAAPGERFAYSNSGYILLAAVIESVSGQSYQAYLESRLFRRAALTSTGFWGSRAPRIAPEQIAVGHDDFGRSGSPLDRSAATLADAGHTGAVSTVDDLARWIDALTSGRVISRERVTRMWTTGPGGYGLGWFVKKNTDGVVVSHDGDGDGFGAHLSWTPSTRRLVVELSNVRIDWAPIHVKAYNAVHAILDGRVPVMPPAFNAGGLADAARFNGVYAIDDHNRFVVAEVDGRLSIGAEGQRAVDLLRPSASAAANAQRTALAGEALEQYLKGDSSGFKKIGVEAQDVLDAVKAEITHIGGDRGTLRSFQVLGTFPAGQPGIDNTVIQLVFERGCGTYKWRWDKMHLEGTYTRSTFSAAPTFMQPVSADTFVAWNILDAAPPTFTVSFSTHVDGQRVLSFAGSGTTITASSTQTRCSLLDTTWLSASAE